MNDRLAGPRLKIERAKKHLRELEAGVQEFFGLKPCAVGTKRDPATRRPIYYLTSVRETPPEFAIIAGEIIQNLRSTLDHLAYQLVQVGTGNSGPFWHVAFPIFDSDLSYENGKGGRTKGMLLTAILVIDSLKPYRGGNDTLWRLHQLNNIDKHRLLVTVGSQYSSFDFGGYVSRKWPDFVGQSPVDKAPRLTLHLRPADRLFPMKAGGELFADLPDAEVDEQLQFVFDVVLSEPGVIEGEPLVETLRQMVYLVDGIIPLFQPLLS